MDEFQVEPYTRQTGSGPPPKGPEFYYRCKKCGTVIYSQTPRSCGCVCDNIWIEVEYIRLVVRDYSAFEVLRKVV